jgi:DNA-binding CsgD family transcriptional regulator
VAEADSAASILGREDELEALGSFLDAIGDGGRTLVLEGEPGIGKTTLWRAGIAAARERAYCVLSAEPTASEVGLPFATAGDLLEPVLGDVLPELPVPQQHALRVALALEESPGRPPDQRAIAVAFLGALRTLARERPVVVAVDDVQWADASSVGLLEFAARRILDEPVRFLLALRVDQDERLPASLERGLQEQLQRVSLTPLSMGAVHRLLHRRLGVTFPRPTLRRIWEASGGNPFFALEIGRALIRKQIQLAPGEPLPVPDDLRALIGDRLAALPRPTRDALAIAAALSDPSLGRVAAAAGGDAALRPALEADVLVVEGGRLRFSHPLLASTAYEQLDALARRALHRRLASLVADEEERARHLALAVDGPDEDVAAALERAAAHAKARGSSSAASELCEQARRLTPPDRCEDAHRRTLAAARNRFEAGDATGARTLLESAIGTAPEGALLAETLALLALVELYEGDQPQAAELARRTLSEEAAEARVRAQAGMILATSLLFMRENLEEGREVAGRAVELARRLGDRSLEGNALGTKAFLECLLGHPGAAETSLAAERLSAVATADRVAASPTCHRAHFLLWTDGAAEALALLRLLEEEALARGDEASMPMIVPFRALAEYFVGNWRQAATDAQEGYEVALQTGQRTQQAFALSVRALVRASVGDEARARADAEAAVTLAGDRGVAAARATSVWALGLLELSLDRPGEAVRVLAQVRQPMLAAGVREPGTIRFFSNEIEALIALGRGDEAEPLLEWLDERGHALGRPSALTTAARSRGILCATRHEFACAKEAFERSLVEAKRLGQPFERGRTLLAYGVALRLARRRREARERLQEALAIFDELGAALWSAKAHGELTRIGGRAPAEGGLTPTEERVAAMVAAGHTNREVASGLFITPRTVEGHLTRIYSKLGVRSRTELARRLSQNG